MSEVPRTRPADQRVSVIHVSKSKSSTKSTSASTRTGHPSKGGNGAGTSKPIKTAAEYAQDRALAKKRKAARPATGLSEIAQNPHVNATKAARQAVYETKQKAKKIQDTREAVAILAAVHPEVTSLRAGSPARKAADLFLRTYATIAMGTCPRTAAKAKTKQLLADHSTNAVHCGIMRAIKALDDSFSFTVAPAVSTS